MSAFSGIDARIEEKVEGIVHLGAIASPGEAADEVEFSTNTVSTYNVFEAARRLVADGSLKRAVEARLQIA